MTSTVACPECAQPVDPKSRVCKHCGVDLAIAAAFAEQSIQDPYDFPSGLPMTPEVLVPKLGSYLVQNGLLSDDGLNRALAYQDQNNRNGRPILIGQALREMGLIDADTLDQAVTVQILELQRALRDSNRQLEARVQERTQALQEALAKLTELSQLKANFLANISHELRTPLTHLKGYLDLLAENGLGSLNRSQQDAIAVMKKSEERLEHLIEDLIQFSIASRGELELNLTRVDINSLVQSTLQQASAKADLHEIQLLSSVPADVKLVRCDREKISWVLNQLTDNAIKFTPERGKVKILVEPKVYEVEVSVIDTGIGIPEGRMLELFEPFHQLDGSATRRYGGTGLGLALTRRILTAHNSQLDVKSKEGTGSKFSFTLMFDDPNGNRKDS